MTLPAWAPSGDHRTRAPFAAETSPSAGRPVERSRRKTFRTRAARSPVTTASEARGDLGIVTDVWKFPCRSVRTVAFRSRPTRTRTLAAREKPRPVSRALVSPGPDAGTNVPVRAVAGAACQIVHASAGTSQSARVPLDEATGASEIPFWRTPNHTLRETLRTGPRAQSQPRGQRLAYGNQQAVGEPTAVSVGGGLEIVERDQVDAQGL